ncbi:MAG: translation initiation factor IF-2 [Bacillota bacterium]
MGRPLPKSESFQPPKTPPPEAQPEAEKTVKTEEIAAPAKPPAAANAAPAAAPTTAPPARAVPQAAPATGARPAMAPAPRPAAPAAPAARAPLAAQPAAPVRPAAPRMTPPGAPAQAHPAAGPRPQPQGQPRPQPGAGRPSGGGPGRDYQGRPGQRVFPAAPGQPAPGQPGRAPQHAWPGRMQPGQPSARPQPGRGPAPQPGRGPGTQPGRGPAPQGRPYVPPGRPYGRGPAARGPAARAYGRPGQGQAPARPTAEAKKPAARLNKPIRLEGSLTVAELAAKLALKGSDVIRSLIGMGMMVSINQEIDPDTARIVATELGYTVEEFKAEVEVETEVLEKEKEEDPTLRKNRPPIVTVMGHVDHGKTSLLDAIRKTNVTASEAGGITQHIGAYTVDQGDRRITFIDTPGHEAFTSMRARGAQITDVAVLVVAAEDGVMPQTVEAINHAKAAEVPILVAINKIDKPEAQPERVKRQLADLGLLAEDWGGKTVMVPVSARTRQGLDTLLEMILLVADMEDIKANPDRDARGTIIEAKLDKGRGPVATLLVQSGTLRVGDVFTCGATWGKVRAMVDDKGKRAKKAGPSQPVEVLGFEEVPAAGDTFVVVGDEKKVREIAARRQEKKRQEEQEAARHLTLDDVYRQIREGQIKELNLIVKADAQGSVEALEKAFSGIQQGEVKVKVIHGGVGSVNENDVMLASASGAIIIGFNVRPDPNARRVAEREKVDIRTYRIIYEAVDDIKAAMVGLLAPEFKEVVTGRAEVRQLFKVPKVGVVAGCSVTDGKITRTAGVRVIREGRVVWEGKIDSLRRFKDDVREVAEGYECGIGLENYNDIKEGDVFEAYVSEEVKREVTP